MSSEQAEKVLEQATQALGLHDVNETDPDLIQGLFKEFEIHDFTTSNKALQQTINDCKTKPQDLRPLKSSIAKNLVTYHPALIEFLAEALKKNLLKPSDEAVKSLHTAFLLEFLTISLCNNHAFLVELHNHHIAKMLSRGLNLHRPFRTSLRLLRTTRSVFLTMKLLSVNPAMIYLRTQRGLRDTPVSKAEAKKLLRQRKINRLEYMLLKSGKRKHLDRVNTLLLINIYEAGITDHKKGHAKNAVNAHTLGESIKSNPPIAVFEHKAVLPRNYKLSLSEGVLDGENNFPSYKLSQDWVSIYTGWNIAFVLGHIDDWDIVLPKLLIPSVLGSQPENYMVARGVALWLTTAHAFYRIHDQESDKKPNRSQVLAEMLGGITEKYALKLAETEVNLTPDKLNESYERFFKHPIKNWLGLVRRGFLE